MVETVSTPATEDWTSIGVGPMQIFATGPGATYAISDTEPPAILRTAFPVPYLSHASFGSNATKFLNTTSQVWIKANSMHAPSVIAAVQ